MKKKYMAPAMKMHKIVSLNLICLSGRGDRSINSGSLSDLNPSGPIKAGSRRLDVEDDIFDEFENGSIWDF